MNNLKTILMLIGATMPIFVNAKSFEDIDESYGKSVPMNIKKNFENISNEYSNFSSFQGTNEYKQITKYFITLTTDLKGKVTNAEGKPIKNATVKIEQIRNRMGALFPTEVDNKRRSWESITDGNGFFIIKNIPVVFPTRVAIYSASSRNFPSNLLIIVNAATYKESVTRVASINKTVLYLAKKSFPLIKIFYNSIYKKDLKINHKTEIPENYLHDFVTVDVKMTRE